jgi:ABC-type ATPase with predicted acetyltransferase domain
LGGAGKRPRGVPGAGCPLPGIEGGRVVLITGASGAGKSSLMRHIRSRYDRRLWIDLGRVKLPRRAVVDCFPARLPVEEVLAALGRVGLGEVWTYLRRPEQLSDGQRWRLRLALGLERAKGRGGRGVVVLACDEFGALLDRVTAAVVARVVRRVVAASPGVCAVLATSHDDLGEALGADVIVRCDFGKVEVG